MMGDFLQETQRIYEELPKDHGAQFAIIMCLLAAVCEIDRDEKLEVVSDWLECIRAGTPYRSPPN